MLKFDLRVKLGRVTSGAKIAVSAFKRMCAQSGIGLSKYGMRERAKFHSYLNDIWFFYF